jgi:hypothetical protein
MNPSNDPQSSSASPDAGCACSDPSQSSATGSLSKAADKIKEASRGAAEQIKSTASQTAARVKETATHYKDRAAEAAAERKTEVADRLGRYGSAVHQSAQSFEEQDQNIAYFAHRAADRIDGIADYVRTRDFAGLKRDAEGLARRNPALFFGGLFVAGLVVGNLLKAKPPATRTHSESESEEAEYGTLAYPLSEEVPTPETLT